MKFVVLIVLFAFGAQSFENPAESGLAADTTLVNPFKAVGNFTLGVAQGLQSKLTPLSACYNNTAKLHPAFEAVSQMVVKCAFFNFTACNDVPAVLTLFNTQFETVSNSCKLPILIEKIEALSDPQTFSEIMVRYFTHKSAISTDLDQMTNAFKNKQYIIAGQNFGAIVRMMLSFTVS
ncbi:unnamed protein product [Blepharisma stoltei]|uniref:Uncharacterized protein n=1 Tax=Blepharisma stoltei TaxID=1481888 RepID=A0AAU9JYQ3_9CILI|nr:unnamed protein product [Blepharisma stoltei]